MLGPLSLLLPPIVLLTSLATLPFTLLTLALSRRTTTLSTWASLRQTWFKHFWYWFGPGSKAIFAPTVRPLLAQLKGPIVLDIGPASGVWMRELGEAVKKSSSGGAASSAITKIYGVEPNVEFHAQLRDAAKKAGLEDVYEPVAVKAQDLEAFGVGKGSVDTVVTVHVLCSVGGQAEEVVRGLYEVLRPGGQWLVYEHVVAKKGVVRSWQAVCNTVWGTLLDGCNLQRDTEKILREAGEWESIQLGPDAREDAFESLPHVVGRLVKKAV
ncbi:hypothetical protein Q7P37_011193 [Cladosporium fusiforme]